MKKQNKSRIIFLLRFLMENSDSEHSFSIYELIDLMERNGFGAVTRKTATDDINALRESGFDIVVENQNVLNRYYFNGWPLLERELESVLKALKAYDGLESEELECICAKLMQLSNVYGRDRLKISIE